MSVILPRHLGMHLTHNEHKLYYETVENFVREFDIQEWASSDDYLQACITDELWYFHCYPDTPVGFYRKYASTFRGLMEIMGKELADDLQNYE